MREAAEVRGPEVEPPEALDVNKRRVGETTAEVPGPDVPAPEATRVNKRRVDDSTGSAESGSTPAGSCSSSEACAVRAISR